jgi:uncharacterized protein DUF4287
MSKPTATQDKVKGPASYFPSIERTYGRPIDEWLDLVRTRTVDTHMQTVAWLKAEHGLGHGHANAIVAHVRADAK